MPINGLGARLKRVWSRDRVVTCDRVADQSLGRSGGLFPGSRAIGSRDTIGVELFPRRVTWKCHDSHGSKKEGDRYFGRAVRISDSE